jgi:hypothetical protein
MVPVQVRQQLIDALRLDLVGPDRGLGNPTEVLPQSPARWYLTGFLVPIDAADEQRAEEGSTEELAAQNDAAGLDDATTPEPAAARRAYFPSSIGLSLLIPAGTKELMVTARWGDYKLKKPDDGHGGAAEWQRTPHEESIALAIPEHTKQPIEKEVPKSGGLKIALSVRPVPATAADGGLPKGTRSLSLFLVNRRHPAADDRPDEASAFQAQLEVGTKDSFVPRPDLRSLESNDWDDLVADVQYRDDRDYSVGHNVATEAVLNDGACRMVRTCWIPQGEVERVAPAEIPGVELSMDALATLADGKDAKDKLGSFVQKYQAWIASERTKAPASPNKRKETAQQLLKRAEVAARRIEQGIALLADSQCLEAFRLANQVMAAAARRRQGVMVKVDPATIKPTWRPFQLAFILMNLPGIADPPHDDREVVDLLFFPTGGGKTEAYLGLAAFTLLLRRLRNPGVGSAGVTVLMRYTLRLLTLDQLSRASTLICALELERQKDVEKLGEWPFEIGLWVGQAATPNRMGEKGDQDQATARAKPLPTRTMSVRPHRFHSKSARGAEQSLTPLPSS